MNDIFKSFTIIFHRMRITLTAKNKHAEENVNFSEEMLVSAVLCINFSYPLATHTELQTALQEE